MGQEKKTSKWSKSDLKRMQAARCGVGLRFEMLMYPICALRFDGQESECRGARDGESGLSKARLASHPPEVVSGF